MIKRMVRQSGLAVMAAALLLLSGGIAAEASPWKTVQTDTGVQYRIGNEIRNSFVIHCAAAARMAETWIDMTVHGEPLPVLKTVHVKIGHQEFNLEVNGNGRISPVTKTDDTTFHRFWEAMRNGGSMIVNYPDGLSGTFTLRGTTEAMPARACAASSHGRS